MVVVGLFGREGFLGPTCAVGCLDEDNQREGKECQEAKTGARSSGQRQSVWGMGGGTEEEGRLG